MEELEKRVNELETKVKDMKIEVVFMKICYGIAITLLDLWWLGVIK